jgi:predicted RNA-binding protein YlxR (DUF448 family)
MCTGCRKRKPKFELIRIVKVKLSSNFKSFSTGQIIFHSADFQIFIDCTKKSIGRGTYLCKDCNCLKKAKKARKFEKIYPLKIINDLYTKLEEEIAR